MYNYLEYFLAAFLVVFTVILVWFVLNIKKLKKPFTEDGIHEHFLVEWKKKIEDYDILGFLKLGYFNNIKQSFFYIIRPKPEFFYKNLV